MKGVVTMKVEDICKIINDTIELKNKYGCVMSADDIMNYIHGLLHGLYYGKAISYDDYSLYMDILEDKYLDAIKKVA